MKRHFCIIALVILIPFFSGCTTYVRADNPGPDWVPGHYGPYGGWHPGHWR